MRTTSKSTKKAAGAVIPEFVGTFSPLVPKRVAQVAGLQKKALDIAVEHTTEWIADWKKASSYFPVTPPAFIFEGMGQAVQIGIENQKCAIDLVVEQTNAAAGIAKVRAEAYSKIAEGVTVAIRKSVERSVEAQKKVFEFASEQNNAVFESTRKHLGAAAGPATEIVDTFQRATNAVIDAQRSFLNIETNAYFRV